MKSNLSAVQRTVLYTVTQEYGVDRPIVYSNNKIILQLKEFFILYFTVLLYPPFFVTIIPINIFVNVSDFVFKVQYIPTQMVVNREIISIGFLIPH